VAAWLDANRPAEKPLTLFHGDYKLDNVLFASEMIGAVRGIDPTTGHYYDDTRRYVDATPHLTDGERFQVFEGNARRVFPRLDAALKRQGR